MDSILVLLFGAIDVGVISSKTEDAKDDVLRKSTQKVRVGHPVPLDTLNSPKLNSFRLFVSIAVFFGLTSACGTMGFAIAWCDAF